MKHWTPALLLYQDKRVQNWNAFTMQQKHTIRTCGNGFSFHILWLHYCAWLCFYEHIGPWYGIKSYIHSPYAPCSKKMRLVMLRWKKHVICTLLLMASILSYITRHWCVLKTYFEINAVMLSWKCPVNSNGGKHRNRGWRWFLHVALWRDDDPEIVAWPAIVMLSHLDWCCRIAFI